MKFSKLEIKNELSKIRNDETTEHTCFQTFSNLETKANKILN